MGIFHKANPQTDLVTSIIQMCLDFILGKDLPKSFSFTKNISTNSKKDTPTLMDALSYVRDRQKQIHKRKGVLKGEIEQRVQEYKNLNSELAKVETVLNLNTK